MRRTALAAVIAGLACPAWPQSAEELQRMLRERDARIRELTERLDALEKKPALEDEELSRALERTLVQQGAQLLPAKTYEIEPQTTYERWDKDRGPLRRVAGLGLAVRAGLPWQSQFQLRLSYLDVATSTASGSNFGDTDFSLSRQLAQERGGWPSLFATGGWVSRTGRDGFNGGVPTGGGFNVAYGGLNAAKKSDPLVFYGGVSYASPRPREISGARLAPGDVLGIRLATALAASPGVSLNAGLNFGFVQTSRVDGLRVADSDDVLGSLQLGVGAILSRSAMLNVSGEFRVSGAVPNFRLVLGLPIRF
jgi:hypothetical protein